MNVALVLFKADGTRCDYPLNKSKTVIGRTARCDLRIPLGEVSRRHCEIRITRKDVIIRDLGSCNGTFHNANAIKNAKLQPGDEVVIGPVIFTVMIDDEPTHIYPRRTLVRQVNKPGQEQEDNTPLSLDGSSRLPIENTNKTLQKAPVEVEVTTNHLESHGRSKASDDEKSGYFRGSHQAKSIAKGGIES